MKFSILIIAFAFTLAMVNTQDIKTSNSSVNQDTNSQSMPFVDQLLDGYLKMLQKKIQSHSMVREDLRVLEFLVKLIYARQKQIEDEERNRPIVYWHLRQGRSN